MKIVYEVIFMSYISCFSFLQLNANSKISQSQSVVLRRMREVEQITFTDKRLEDCVREEIQKPTGVLTMSDLDAITEIDLSNKGIESLADIEFLTRLKKLFLSNNRIKDIAPLEYIIRRGLDEFTIDGNNELNMAQLGNLDSWMRSGQRNMVQAERLNGLGYKSIPVIRGDLLFSNDIYNLYVKDGSIIRVTVANSAETLWKAGDNGIELVQDIRIMDIPGEGRKLIIIGINGVFDISLD